MLGKLTTRAINPNEGSDSTSWEEESVRRLRLYTRISGTQCAWHCLLSTMAWVCLAHLFTAQARTYMRADRWFTYLFDASLRHTCGYSGPTPYWDWSLDHTDLFGAPVFEDSPEYGLGGTGDCDSSPEADCTVTTGAFAPSNGDFELAWPIPHPLRRNLTLLTGWIAHELPQNRTLGSDFVRNMTERTTGDFFRFQHAMELLHNHVHNFVGGDMGGDCPKAIPDKDCDGIADTFTPNDPLFWLHHAQIDRLWSEVRFQDQRSTPPPILLR